MKFYIEDYDLNAAELETKYCEAEQHPGYTRQLYEQSSRNLDYWEWVKASLGSEQDELDRDNPYNTPYDFD